MYAVKMQNSVLYFLLVYKDVRSRQNRKD